MLTVTEAGAILVPPTPAFYTNPKTLDDFVDQVVSRVMDMFDIPNELTTRWG
jgi:3-polyprenyl-4-hydroxybenzoate decarboxylase